MGSARRELPARHRPPRQCRQRLPPGCVTGTSAPRRGLQRYCAGHPPVAPALLVRPIPLASARCPKSPKSHSTLYVELTCISYHSAHNLNSVVRFIGGCDGERYGGGSGTGYRRAARCRRSAPIWLVRDGAETHLIRKLLSRPRQRRTRPWLTRPPTPTPTATPATTPA